jgi:2-keto-4-pentenoate hydratase
VYASPARLKIVSFSRVLAEIEIAFRFERALTARAEPYTREEVFGAFATMAVAVIVDTRFAQWPNLAPLAQPADAQNSGARVVGNLEPLGRDLEPPYPRSSRWLSTASD